MTNNDIIATIIAITSGLALVLSLWKGNQAMCSDKHRAPLTWVTVGTIAFMTCAASTAYLAGEPISPRNQGAIINAGYQAGYDGIPIQACPYGDTTRSDQIQPTKEKALWISGWQDGFRVKNNLQPKERP